jgi:hypothetical protein
MGGDFITVESGKTLQFLTFTVTTRVRVPGPSLKPRGNHDENSSNIQRRVKRPMHTRKGHDLGRILSQPGQSMGRLSIPRKLRQPSLQEPGAPV